MNYGYVDKTAAVSSYGQAAQTVAGTYPADAPSRQLEVPGAMGRLDTRISTLFDAVRVLDDRLTGYIARPQAPQPEKAGALKGAPATGLGSQLDAACDQLEAMAGRLYGLIERLEA